MSAAALTDALEEARAGKKTKTATLLEQAGAKPYDDFKIDAAVLSRFAGTYADTRSNQLIVSVAGTRLSIHPVGAPPDQQMSLVAKDATTFRGIGMQGTMFVFSVAGDKVTSFTITPAQGAPAIYTRVEGK